MAWKLTIDGVDQTDQIGSADINFGEFNGRATATFRLITKPDILPNRLDEIVSYAKDGITPVFGGVILQRSVNGVERSNDDDAVSLECGDFWTYADFRRATLTYPSDVDLEDVIADLAAYLSIYGISYTPTATGITLGPFSWSRKRVSDAFRELIERIPGRTIRFTPSKTIVLVTVGAASAPFSLTDADSHCIDLEWTDSNRTPANRIILTCGPASDAWAFVDPILFLADGVASSWTFDVADGVPYTDDGGGGTIHVGGVVKNSAVGEFTWTLDDDNATATLALVPAVAPSVGTQIDFKRNIQPPFIVIATSGASPVIEESAEREDVLSVPQAVEIAEGLLEQLDQQPKEITVFTDEDGFEGGQELTIALTPRSLSGTFIITSVSAMLEQGLADTEWLYTLKATDLFQGTPMDKWRAMLGGTGGSLPSTVGSATITVTALTGPAFLGGARNTFVEPDPAAWVPAPNWVAFNCRANMVAQMVVEIGVLATGSVKARLWDITASAAVAGSETASETSTGMVQHIRVVTLDFDHAYRLELQNSAAGIPVRGIGFLEAVP